MYPVDEVERALAPAEVRWDGSLGERRESAHGLAASAVKLATTGELVLAAAYLRCLGELVVEDPGAELNGDVEDEIGLLDARCAEALAGGGDAAQAQAALLVRFWAAWLSGDSLEDQFAFLDRAVALEGHGSIALGCQARLRRASELDRAGRSTDADAEFDSLLSRLQDAPGLATPEFLLDVWYERCIGRSGAESWAQAWSAAETVDSYYAQIEDRTPVMKARFAEAWWVRCVVLARTSTLRAGERSTEAMATLDRLIVWLGGQSELSLRRLLICRLTDKMRWLGTHSAAIDTVEEIISKLADLDDCALTRHVAVQVAAHMPDLAALDESESGAMAEAYVRAVNTAGTEGKVSDLGRASLGPSTSRSERLLSVLAALQARLKADADPRAVPVRALILINEMIMLGRHGYGAEQQRRVEELVRLGEPALDACDAVASHPVALHGQAIYPVTLLMPMFKAALLAEWGRFGEALTTYSDLMDQFSGFDEPWGQAMLKQAAEARDELQRHSQP